MSEHWVYTGGQSYLVTGDAGGELDDILAWMAADHGRPAPVVALSRQQVLTRIARTTLPTGFDHLRNHCGADAEPGCQGLRPLQVYPAERYQ